MNPSRPASLFLPNCLHFSVIVGLRRSFWIYEVVLVCNVKCLGACNLKHFPKLYTTCSSVLFFEFQKLLSLLKYHVNEEQINNSLLKSCAFLWLCPSVVHFQVILLDIMGPVWAALSLWVLLGESTKLTNWKLTKLNMTPSFSLNVRFSSQPCRII